MRASHVKAVAVEALVVAVLFVVVLMTVHGVVEMGILKNGTPKSHGEYMARLAVLGAVSAALLHIVCEARGINKWYCNNGAACAKL